LSLQLEITSELIEINQNLNEFGLSNSCLDTSQSRSVSFIQFYPTSLRINRHRIVELIHPRSKRPLREPTLKQTGLQSVLLSKGLTEKRQTSLFRIRELIVIEHVAEQSNRSLLEKTRLREELSSVSISKSQLRFRMLKLSGLKLV
jgi:hypothetical protein